MLVLHPTVLPRQGIEPQAQRGSQNGGHVPKRGMWGRCKFVTRDWRVEGAVK